MSDNRIDKIRVAADSQDWEAFKEALKETICDIQQDELSYILWDYVREFVREFARNNPTSQPQMDSIIAKEHMLPADSEVSSVIEFFDQYKGLPGVNNFRRSLRKYSKLSRIDYCQSEYVETWITSIINLFNSIPSQVWGHQNPALHQRWQEGPINDALMILTEHKTKDTQYRQMSIKLWNRLADQLQTHISQDGK